MEGELALLGEKGVRDPNVFVQAHSFDTSS